MWLMSTAADTQLRGTHSAGGRVDILHAGKAVRSLTVNAGSVDAQADRPVMRNLSGTFADETGELSGSDIGDLLSPYDAELAAYRGVLVGNTVEWAPQGIFGITGKDVGDYNSIQITGQDRSMIYQGGMTGSLAIAGNTSVENAIHSLLVTRNVGLSMRSYRTRYVCGPLLYDPDIDVWKEALDLAASAGGTLFHDRLGLLNFAPNVPIGRLPVRRFAQGDGILIDVTRSEDSDTIHNVVIVESTKTNNGAIIRGIAEDKNPSSPTYSRCRYGRRSITITNQHVSSIEQAVDVATTYLVRELGRTETGSFTAVVDPRLDPLDVVALHHPGKEYFDRAMVVQGITIPLRVKEAMSVSLRKSIITQNGQVLDATAQVTTS
jgi:hypothetical protein